MEFADRLRKKQCQNIAKGMGNSALHDVTFLIGSDQIEFRASRLILALISEVFQAMLFGQMQEGQRDCEVIIDDIDPNGFISVLNYAYCKDPAITMDNVVAVKCICRKYQISDLSALCDEYFESNVDSTNICSLWTDATSFKLTEYKELCQTKVKGDIGFEAEDIIKSDGFMKMSKNAIGQFLQNDDLQIAEEALWEAVVKWSKYQSDQSQNGKSNNSACDDEPASKRRKTENQSNQVDNRQLLLLRSLAPHIRFGLMDAAYFIKNIQPMGCLSDSEMLAITNYIVIRDTDPQYQCGRFNVKKRRATIVCIKRGIIDANSFWSHNAGTDAICISTNNDCYLHGIGIFACEGSLNVECKVYDGHNGAKRSGTIIFAMKAQTFTFPSRTGAPFELQLTSKVLIKKNKKYTIEIKQKNASRKTSKCIKRGKRIVSVGGLTVTFREAKNIGNGTDCESGVLPSLYFTV